MNRLWRVAAYEYRRNVFKRSFIFTLLSIPFFIALSVGLGLFIESQRDNSQPVGYVDHAGVLATALMTAIGAVVTTTHEGNSVSALFFILHILPFYVSWSFFSAPHSALAIAMSVMPFTALMTVGMRNLFTIVPAWQVGISVAAQTLCAAGAIWLASRAFRLGMLRYGQRLRWRRVFQW